MKIDLGVGNEAVATKSKVYYEEPEDALIGTIQGSNNDTDWTDLKAFSYGVDEVWYSDYFNNDTAYRYYRFFIDSGTLSSAWPAIQEWELYNGGAAPSYDAGVFGQAFEFFGVGDYVEVGNNGNFNLHDDLTASV